MTNHANLAASEYHQRTDARTFGKPLAGKGGILPAMSRSTRENLRAAP
jgi:hypothetical protein